MMRTNRIMISIASTILFISLARCDELFSGELNNLNISDTNNTAILQDYGEFCLNSSNCYGQFRCILTGLYEDSLCLKTYIPVGEDCLFSVECGSENATCVDGKCTVLASRSDSLWGEPCKTEYDCFDDTEDMLYCLQGLDDNLRCLKSNISLGYECKDTTECSAGVQNAICSNVSQECVCGANYWQFSSSCLPLESDTDIEDTFPKVNEIITKTTWGNECLDADEIYCDGLRGLLFCRKDSDPSNHKFRCLKPYAQLGETCIDLAECQVWDKNSECNRVCTCKHGYMQTSKNSDCKQVGTDRELPPGYYLPCNGMEEICRMNGLHPTNASEKDCYCLHPASLWEKCYTDEDCLAKDIRSKCKFFAHGIRQCVCHAGFLEDQQCFAPSIGAAEIILYIAIICSCAAVFSIALMGLSCARHCRCDCLDKKKGPYGERIIYTRLGVANKCAPDVVLDGDEFEFRTSES